MTEPVAVVRGGAPRRLWGAVRIVGAVVIAAAIVVQLQTTLAIAHERGQHLPTVLTNFFSFFTVLSNVLGALTLVIGGVWLLIRGARPEPRTVSVLFLAVGTCMVTTGIVYNVLLRGIPLPQGATVPWSNEVLHGIGPALFLIDLVLRLGRRLRWHDLGFALVFPLAWVGYTLVRGEAITNPATGKPWWYPYPFLDPYVTPNGYIGVAGYVVGIAAVILAVAAATVWWTRFGRAPVGEAARAGDDAVAEGSPTNGSVELTLTEPATTMERWPHEETSVQPSRSTPD